MALRNAIELSGGYNPTAQYGLAWTFYELKRESEALVALREFLDITPPNEVPDEARVLTCTLRRSLRDQGFPEVMVKPLSPGSDPPSHAGSGDVSRPEKISAPPPQRTLDDVLNRTKGQVITQSIIDREGCVVEIKILEGSPPSFTVQALRSLQSWVFRPAMRDGKPVDVYYNLVLRTR